MFQIGVLTQDRVACLDATLRSLSACELPSDVCLTVFDDGSQSSLMHRYLRTTEEVQVERPWPCNARWEKLGLGAVSCEEVPIRGISDKVPVVQLDSAPQGVVRASCQALRYMFTRQPDAPGVVLLQDDVVFNGDWVDRLLAAVRQREKLADCPVGLMAGMKLNTRLRPRNGELSVASGITAQCLYVTQATWQAHQDRYLGREHSAKRRFDDTFRRAVGRAGLWAGCMVPFVGQHIGVRSLVRPHVHWGSRKGGRIGLHSNPPYVLATEVRRFL